MSKASRYIILPLLLAASLACGLITTPISEAKNIASTAEAYATTNPLQTLEALPSAMPDVSQYTNPVGTPVSQWNDIPIMPQAAAGQEFSDSVYSFRVDASVDDVQAFYKDGLTTLGWKQDLSAQGGANGGLMFFTKDTNLLTITITQADEGGLVVVLLKE